jgi:chromosome segregation ATPase
MPSFVYFGIILVALSGAGALYYKSTQAKIETLTAYNATLTANVNQLEEVNKTNIDTIARIQSNFESQRKQFNKAQESFAEIRSQNNELKEKLGKHDLGVLAAAKPALVEKIINTATAKVLRCFELESGAQLKEKERTAKDAKAFNDACPWIYDDLVASGVLVTSNAASQNSNKN